MIYKESHTLEELALKVRNKYHGKRLGDAVVLILFQDTATSSGGRKVVGKAKMPNALDKFLCEKAWGVTPDFLILIAMDCWKELDERQRRALLDHELTHCDVRRTDKGATTYGLRGHDVEEFVEVIRRHGLWDAGVRDFWKATRQLKLPGTEKKDNVVPMRSAAKSVKPKDKDKK